MSSHLTQSLLISAPLFLSVGGDGELFLNWKETQISVPSPHYFF
uniref:Uncharacterized protein n=1 Tax=Anguilla anguilla TaxID=7936 RepID=A0A0E9RG75_ANGAN